MRKWFLGLLFLLLTNPALATVSISAFVTADDVTIAHLEEMRTELSDEINSFPGTSIQTGTIAATKLDADANPHNRWNEAFNDFVYTGLTIPTTVGTLTGISDPGIMYMNGVRVVKDATSNLYTANRDIYVDLSDNGVFTYTTVTHDANGSTAPAVAADSLRLARVSTDSTKLQYIEDLRVTTISLGTNSSAIQIADADNDTKITTQFNPDEDILRFRIGNTTLSTAKEALTIQAIDSTNVKVEPGTDNIVDLGSSSKQYRNAYIKGTATVGTLTATSATITNLTASSATIGGGTPGAATFTTVSSDVNYLSEQSSNPNTVTNVGAVYTKDVGGASELFYRSDANGSVTQITNAGTVNSGVRLSSTTSPSAATNTGDISFTNTKYYLVVVSLTSHAGGASDTLLLRFNNDTGSNYQYVLRGFGTDATAENANSTGTTGIQVSGAIPFNSTNTQVNMAFYIYPNNTSDNDILVKGTTWADASSASTLNYWDFFGYHSNGPATSFRILTSGGGANTFSGKVYLYELSQ